MNIGTCHDQLGRRVADYGRKKLAAPLEKSFTSVRSARSMTNTAHNSIRTHWLWDNGKG